MSRTPSKTFTEKELEIMRVIWGSSEATAREIQARLPGERHYNSVLTIIRVLERKGHLTHRVAGKAHVYRACQQPEKSRSRLLSHLIRQVFSGSAASLVLHLVETGDLTEDDLREVRQQMAVLPWWSQVAQRFPVLQPASPTLSYVTQAPRAVVDIAPRTTAQTLAAAEPVKATVRPSAKATVRSPILGPLLFAVWMLGVLIT